MDETYFKIIFGILWIIYILIRVPFDKRYKITKKLSSVSFKGDKFMFILLAAGLVIAPLMWMIIPGFSRFELHFPLWVRLAGVVISIFSLFYFRYIHKTLGANWSPALEIMKDHHLVKTGPYKSVRHPMYMQIWIWTVAQLLIISNMVTGFAGIIAWAIFYFMRISKEEKMMIEHFGNEYIDYMHETGRIFPKI